MRVTLHDTKYFPEWTKGGERREVPAKPGTGHSHWHYMAPMGFEVCGAGRAGCQFKMPAWIEGQVQRYK